MSEMAGPTPVTAYTTLQMFADSVFYDIRRCTSAPLRSSNPTYLRNNFVHLGFEYQVKAWLGIHSLSVSTLMNSPLEWADEKLAIQIFINAKRPQSPQKQSSFTWDVAAAAKAISANHVSVTIYNNDKELGGTIINLRGKRGGVRTEVYLYTPPPLPKKRVYKAKIKRTEPRRLVDLE